MAYDKRRRALGICGHSGCKEKSGKRYYCLLHASLQAQRQKAYQKAEREIERMVKPVDLGDVNL